MQYSYSRVERYLKCPYAYKLAYVDNVQIIKDCKADNALYLGIGIHKGIETTVEQGIEEYYKNYAVASSDNITETMKFEILVPKVKELLNGLKVEHEVKLFIKDVFVGYIDALVDRGNGVYEILDFKYSNNKDSYMNSGQIHVYGFFYKLLHPEVKEIKVGYVFIPKYSKKKAYNVSYEEYRKAMKESLEREKIEITYLPYNENKAIEFLLACIHVSSREKDNVFPKNESSLCYFCDYRDLCLNGDNSMVLPVNRKREVYQSPNMKVWIYGVPMSGKTYLANTFPDALFLNTDGNINSFDSPVVQLKNTVEPNSKRTIHGYEVFENTIVDLEKAQKNGTLEFKTIVIDLVDGVYALAREACCKKLNIEHESENTLKAYDYIRSSFFRNIMRIINLDVNVVFISHEDKSKDLFAKGGSKITAIQTTLPEKVALKLSSVMDLTVRLCVEKEQNKTIRKLYLPENETVFGGSRLKTEKLSIDCSYEAILQIYENNKAKKAVEPKIEVEQVTEVKSDTKQLDDHKGFDYPTESDDDDLAPITRKRKKKEAPTIDVEEEPVEQKAPTLDATAGNDEDEEELPF